jgi:hypothetical protein
MTQHDDSISPEELGEGLREIASPGLASEAPKGFTNLVKSSFIRPSAAELEGLDFGRRRSYVESALAERLTKEEPNFQDLMRQATDGYEEQDRRAERSERRATTLLGAVSIVAALVAAAGGLLIGSNRVDQLGVRLFLGMLVAATVAAFVMSALYALQVTAVPHYWNRPNTWPSLWNRATRAGTPFHVDALAALVDATIWNQEIADWKARRLRAAASLFKIGLTMLLFLVSTVLVLGATL